jgi:hypothetical protein
MNLNEAIALTAPEIATQCTIEEIGTLRAEAAAAGDEGTVDLLDQASEIINSEKPPKTGSPSKDDWQAPETIYAIEGKIIFVSPAAADARRTVTVGLPDHITSNEIIDEMFDAASDAGAAGKIMPYGMKKAGIRRINMRIHKALLDNAKTGYTIVVPISYTIKGETTYWDKDTNKPAYHDSTGLRTDAPQITSGEDEASVAQRDRDIELIMSAPTDGKAAAIATYLKR